MNKQFARAKDNNRHSNGLFNGKVGKKFRSCARANALPERTFEEKLATAGKREYAKLTK